ncbi:DivIVA domain-containing protein [Streptococcus fryi]
MALTALEIKDKTFSKKIRGLNEDDVYEFLDIVADNYETLVRQNHEQAARIKDLEDKLSYFDEMKESLTQSVILAQETAEKVKASANTESTNILNKATFDANHLIEEAKAKANEILRDATDDAKRVAVETEDLKRQSRIFHQRLLAAVDAQMTLVNSPEWLELLQPTAVYLQNSDTAFKEIVERVLDEHVPDSNDAASLDATRQFSPEEMEELYRLMAESNAQLEAAVENGDVPTEQTDSATEVSHAFQVNISE